MHYFENVKGIAVLIDKVLNDEGHASCVVGFDTRVMQDEANGLIRSFLTLTTHSIIFRNFYKMYFQIDFEKLSGNYKSLLFGSPNDPITLLGDPNAFFHGIGKSIDYRYEFYRPYGVELKTYPFCKFLRHIFFRHICMNDENIAFPHNTTTIEDMLQTPVNSDDVMSIAKSTLDKKKFIKFRMLYKYGIYSCRTRIGADLSLSNLFAIIFRGDPSAIDYEFQMSALYSEMWDDSEHRDRTINKAIIYFFKYYADRC